MNGTLISIWNTDKANLKAKVTGYYPCLQTSSHVHCMTRRQKLKREGNQRTSKTVCARARQRLVLQRKSRAAISRLGFLRFWVLFQPYTKFILRTLGITWRIPVPCEKQDKYNITRILSKSVYTVGSMNPFMRIHRRKWIKIKLLYDQQKWKGFPVLGRMGAGSLLHFC